MKVLVLCVFIGLVASCYGRTVDETYRPEVGDCDKVEHCLGSSSFCPVEISAETRRCRTDLHKCDVPERVDEVPKQERAKKKTPQQAYDEWVLTINEWRAGISHTIARVVVALVWLFFYLPAMMLLPIIVTVSELTLLGTMHVDVLCAMATLMLSYFAVFHHNGYLEVEIPLSFVRPRREPVSVPPKEVETPSQPQAEEEKEEVGMSLPQDEYAE